MLQQRSLIVIGLAVLLGLAAVFVANSYFSSVQKQTEVVPTGSAKVVVARVPMDFGTEITPDKIRLVDLPVGAVPEGSFNWPGQLSPGGKARVALRQIAVNEPILRTAVSGEGGRASISAVLKEDMRALAVRVSDVAGVAGFILPGDTVDVMVTRSIGGGGGEQQQITDVLLQKVRVLAIDQNASQISKDPAIGKTATLEVNQVDAQRLTLGQQVGSLHLALRRVEDQDNPMVATVGLEDLRDNAYSGGFRAPGPQYRPSFTNVNRTAAAVPAPPRFEDIFSKTSSALSKAFGAPAPAAATKAAGPAVPAKPRGPTVEIVRGTTGTEYEVGGNARF